MDGSWVSCMEMCILIWWWGLGDGIEETAIEGYDIEGKRLLMCHENGM